MAAGADFTLVPDLVEIQEPKYNNVITQSESMKKEFLNVSATPEERFRVVFYGLSDTDRSTLLTHFRDNSGGYYPFSWKSVPSYVYSGANMTGRWVEGSFKMSPIGGTRWSCDVVFEKSV